MTVRTFVCALSLASLLGSPFASFASELQIKQEIDLVPASQHIQAQLWYRIPVSHQRNADVKTQKTTKDKQGLIARLEAQIAENHADVEKANLIVQQSAETYGRATDDLLAAQLEAQKAQEKADLARKDAQAVRAKLGQLAASMYRQNAQNLSELQVVTEAEGFRTAAIKQGASAVISAQLDAQVQTLTALQDVAQSMEKQAKAAVEKRSRASEQLKETKDEAQAQAKKAEERLLEAQKERARIIAELARARGVSVDQETTRQQQIDAQRRQRNEAKAAEELARKAQEEEQKRLQKREKNAAAQLARVKRETEAAARAQEQAKLKEKQAKELAEAQAKAKEQQAAKKAQEEAQKAAQRAAQQAQEAQRQAQEAQRQAQIAAEKAAAEKAAKDAQQNAAPAAPSKAGPALLNWARTKIGIPYLWGGTGPDGYDCSGLVFAGMREIGGGSIGRSAAQQYQTTRLVPFNQAQPGDLVFWSSNAQVSGIYHVAIYSGSGRIVMAPKPGQNILELGLYNQNKIMPFVGRI